MTLPKSRQAYNDCYEILDRAHESSEGIRIPVDSYEAAESLRSRLHMARKLHREDNEIAYEPGHAMHGASPYDALVVRIKAVKGKHYLYIEPIDKGRGGIEDLSEVEEEAEPAAKPGDPAVLGAIVEGFRRR